MDIELDHVFIIVKAPGDVGDELQPFGFTESFSRVHQGQGTSNRRFPLGDRMLEIIWVHDHDEAQNGPGSGMCFSARSSSVLSNVTSVDKASPFGIILRRKNNNSMEMPFSGWSYQPLYFSAPQAFHVGTNSNMLGQPLCIYVPFIDPIEKQNEVPLSERTNLSDDTLHTLNHVLIHSPDCRLEEDQDGVLAAVNSACGVSICHGEEHLMEVTVNNHQTGSSKDFRPNIPLLVHY